MDTLYIGDIPLDYHYAVFNNGYIDLYNTQNFQPNREYTYYRVYLYNDKFLYSTNVWATSTYSYTRDTTPIGVSNDWKDRTDVSKIFVCIFLLSLGVMWLINLFTSFFKKGGVFGGLF